ncbi:protein FAM151B-like isoform X1 [Scylla paramamosain]|uniref:protein FAM151B-like isoform X1 n=1 Tax=Scylla paramamosain TaxID=85552 RepID=UPI0030827FAB
MKETAELILVCTFFVCLRGLYRNYIAMPDTAKEGSAAPHTEEGGAQGGTGPLDLAEFFPDVNDDLAKVTWGHGVNSVARLEEVLQDPQVMMMEADIVQGHLEGTEEDDPPLTPIMAHPPHTTSDLTFKMWLDKVIAANQAGEKKGIKLDFKQLDSVRECLDYLKAQNDKITFPVWLNADILPGPVDSPASPVPADDFVSTCVEMFPQATLSLGWTTHIPPGSGGAMTSGYSRADVDRMCEILDTHSVTQPVTFPIRAAFLPLSLEVLEALLDQIPDSTITIWSLESDPFDPLAIVTLRDLLGADAVFLDLPETQMTQYLEVSSSEGKGATGEVTSASLLPTSSILATVGMVLCSALAALYLYE